MQKIQILPLTLKWIPDLRERLSGMTGGEVWSKRHPGLEPGSIIATLTLKV